MPDGGSARRHLARRLAEDICMELTRDEIHLRKCRLRLFKPTTVTFSQGGAAFVAVLLEIPRELLEEPKEEEETP